MNWSDLLFAGFIISVPLGLYYWFRFGPKRCPRCGTLVFGYPGAPVGIRVFHFKCKNCGERFIGHRRLPL
jgi:ribosomal protein S27AE